MLVAAYFLNIASYLKEHPPDSLYESGKSGVI